MNYHTPGPWHHAPDEHIDDGFVILDASGDVIATVSADFDLNTELANARLIAAAPELFESLKLCMAFIPAEDKNHNGSSTEADNAFNAAYNVLGKVQP